MHFYTLFPGLQYVQLGCGARQQELLEYHDIVRALAPGLAWLQGSEDLWPYKLRPRRAEVTESARARTVTMQVVGTAALHLQWGLSGSGWSCLVKAVLVFPSQTERSDSGGSYYVATATNKKLSRVRTPRR